MRLLKEMSASLPPANSPTLQLTQATPFEKTETWKLNGQTWRGALSLPAYLQREEHLASQSLTRNGGVTYWILVDSKMEAHAPRRILASCESYRKRALVATSRNGQVQVEEVVSHGIGSVFCNPEYRGKGYAGRMMIELGKKLKQWQQGEERTSRFTVLYSDIGKVSYPSLLDECGMVSYKVRCSNFMQNGVGRYIPQVISLYRLYQRPKTTHLPMNPYPEVVPCIHRISTTYASLTKNSSEIVSLTHHFLTHGHE